LNDQEDLVEGLCRFASVAMSFALVVMQFELSGAISCHDHSGRSVNLFERRF
jgi:hypothetical protein